MTGLHLKRTIFALCLSVVSGRSIAAAEDKSVSRLPASYELLSDITAVHRGFHGPASNPRLYFKIFEEDGSTTVAVNPVRLILVVSNDESEPPVFGAWALPFGVYKVLRVTASSCGVNIDAKVDDDWNKSGTLLTKKVRFKVCFVDAENRLKEPITCAPSPSPKGRSR